MGDSKDSTEQLPIVYNNDLDGNQTEKKSRENKFSSVVNKLKKFIYRIEIKSGAYVFKMILWIAMAWGIVRFSTDLNAKIIGSITYFVGIMMDMVLLRKHLPEVGVEIRRFFVGVLIVIFFVIVVILILRLMEYAVYQTLESWMDKYIVRALFVCGFMSTFLEFINNISTDD